MRAIVLGRNYASVLGMVRAAGHSGCDVTVIRILSKKQYNKTAKQRIKGVIYGKPIDSASKYVKKYLNCIESDRKRLVSVIKKETSGSSEKTILLPTDDYAASTIDMYQNELQKTCLMPGINGKQGEVVRIMDKDIQKQLAEKAGLDVAKGWTITIKDGKYEIPESISYPCFPKPQISFMGDKKCMQRCDDEAALRKIVDQVAAAGDCPLLVEQFIDIENEYGMLGFCDGKKAYIPAMIHKIAIGSGTHKGVTLLGRVIPAEEYSEIVEKLSAMIEGTGFVGLFDVDLYEMAGKIYFNELNLRLGAFGYSIFCAGINLPGMLIKKLSGLPYENDPVKVTKRIVCLNDKVNIEDYAARYITWEKYKEVISKADFRFISDPDDPAPEKVYRRLERLTHLKQKIKK